MDTRIIEIIEIYNRDGFELDVTLGNKRPTVIDYIDDKTDIPVPENKRIIVSDTDPDDDEGRDGDIYLVY